MHRHPVRIDVAFTQTYMHAAGQLSGASLLRLSLLFRFADPDVMLECSAKDTDDMPLASAWSLESTSPHGPATTAPPALTLAVQRPAAAAAAAAAASADAAAAAPPAAPSRQVLPRHGGSSSRQESTAATLPVSTGSVLIDWASRSTQPGAALRRGSGSGQSAGGPWDMGKGTSAAGNGSAAVGSTRTWPENSDGGRTWWEWASSWVGQGQTGAGGGDGDESMSLAGACPASMPSLVSVKQLLLWLASVGTESCFSVGLCNCGLEGLVSFMSSAAITVSTACLFHGGVRGFRQVACQVMWSHVNVQPLLLFTVWDKRPRIATSGTCPRRHGMGAPCAASEDTCLLGTPVCIQLN